MENGIVLKQSCLLVTVLHISEMRVVCKLEHFIAAEASEGDVALDFVLLGEAVSTMRGDLAVVLDSHDSVVKTVFFDETAVHNALGRILRGRVVKWVLLNSRYFCLSFSLSWVLSFVLEVDVVAITVERTNKAVILFIVELVLVTEGTEDEVVGACKVESLSGEFVLMLICNSHGDIVVRVGTAHTAPEEKLLEVVSACLVQQSLQAHVQS